MKNNLHRFLDFVSETRPRVTWKRNKNLCSASFFARGCRAAPRDTAGGSVVWFATTLSGRACSEAIWRFCIRSWTVFCSKYNEKHKLHTRHGAPTCPHTSGTPGTGHPSAVRPPGTRRRAQTRRSSFVSEIWSFVSEVECIPRILEGGL